MHILSHIDEQPGTFPDQDERIALILGRSVSGRTAIKMDRILAGFFLFMTLAQVQILFAGAVTISMQTNWPRLGAYFGEQLAQLQAPADEQPASAQKQTGNLFVNLSPRSKDKE